MAKRQKYPKSENSTFLRSFRPRNSAQDYYLSALRENTITLCVGPAGTGKTYVATYVALEALLSNQVDKIVLTRPIVATEDIGYLPGDMQEKIHPYIMPLYDALEAHLGVAKAKELLVAGRVEVLPLAYMRGRSLNNAFIILDEAQNTTRDQMRMFLTRIGEGSRMVIDGDQTQSDIQLKHGETNGLSWAVERLTGADGAIGINEFATRDIVRHPLIEKILARLS